MPVFAHHALSHGLTILAEVDPAAHTAAAGFFVRTGARDETIELMGVSHFLEHMMFKGTSRRSAADINREFDEIGANYNAFTSHEATVYYAHVLPEFLPRAVDLLTDMLRPQLAGDDFATEKNVILEEIGMYEDKPAWRLQDTLLETHFAGHPLAHRVLGTRETVAALTPERMRDYFERNYSPDHIILALAGRLDLDAVVAQVEKMTSHWRSAGNTSGGGGTSRQAPTSVALTSHTLADAKLNRHYLALAIPAPSAQDPRRYAARILADVLGDAEGSRLHWALIDPGLADEASFVFEPQDGAGYYLAGACCDPARAAQVEQTLLTELDRIVRSLDLSELQRAQNKIATTATLHGERPLGRMTSLGGTWQYLGQYIPLEEELRRIMAVTPADLADLLRAYPLDRRTRVRLGPTA